jgi:malonyl-CoA/methylmalonyl-CoA synthetase
VAVVALPSDKWGQKVAAVVVLSDTGKTAGKGGKQWSPLDMRRALKDKLANYKIPQDMKVVESIPRNAMGKSKSLNSTFDSVTNLLVVNKKQLISAVFDI